MVVLPIGRVALCCLLRARIIDRAAFIARHAGCGQTFYWKPFGSPYAAK